MSESPTGEMLEFFNALCEESSINFLSARNQDKVLALRRLIEHGPEVSRKKISQLLAQRPSWDTEVCIMQYLRECGVTVKEDEMSKPTIEEAFIRVVKALEKLREEIGKFYNDTVKAKK